MHIALLTDGIHPYVVGGMQKHSYYLAKYLAEKGCRIDLYHFRKYNLEKTKEDVFGKYSNNISLIEVPFPEQGNLPLHYIRESKEYSVRVFTEFLKRPMPDFVISKGFTGWEYIRRKKKGEALPPVAVNFHGYEMFQQAFTRRDKFIQLFLRKPVKALTVSADFVFSYGGKITELLTETLHIPEQKILEFPSGIEESWLQKNVTMPGEKIRFLFIGRFEPRKGLKELNQAIQQLQNNNWTFDFIGDIPDGNRLNKGNIRYHGLVTDQTKIQEIMRGCDVLVCPSWSEGMPNVILEGMASGLAVLATNTGATSLLVSDETGWLINDPEPELIKQALQLIVASSPETIFVRKQNAAAKVRKDFLWTHIADKTLDALKKIQKPQSAK